MFADSGGLDVKVGLSEEAVHVPVVVEFFGFFFLEALEFFDEVELESGTEPVAELDGDVLVGEGAAVAAGFGVKADGFGLFDPLFDRDLEGVETDVAFNSVESDGIKLGVVQLLPHAEEFDGVAVAHPAFDGGDAYFEAFGDVGDADEIILLL